MSDAAIHEICMTLGSIAALACLAFIVWCVTRDGGRKPGTTVAPVPSTWRAMPCRRSSWRTPAHHRAGPGRRHDASHGRLHRHGAHRADRNGHHRPDGGADVHRRGGRSLH